MARHKNATGPILWEADYKPFGEAEIYQKSTEVNNFRFPGQYYDEETGLHYNYHRYYDPKTGRYLTPDPVGVDAGPNLFSYARNNPTNFVDPYGLLDASLNLSSVGVDINIPIYNSASSLHFGTPQFGVSTSLYGVGLQFSFYNPFGPTCDPDTSPEIYGYIGPLSKYLSVFATEDESKIGFALGIGKGVPQVNVSSSMEHFMKRLAKLIEKVLK
jgi:RHS repeat-associated protein